jgi:adenylate cyclase
MMYPFYIEENPRNLAELGFWNKNVYKDLLACQKGHMTEDEFTKKYHKRAAILCLDMTGFTKSTLSGSALYSFFRILNVQKICYPVFKDCGADIIHAFADNFTVIFRDPSDALDASFEIHKRIDVYNESDTDMKAIAQCCIGIGYGNVYSIGHDQAMGDEMNRASVLGEDTAKGSETLVTENVYKELKHRTDCLFKLQTHDDVPFPFYAIQKKEECDT